MENINVICAICGSEMNYEKDHMSIGSNDACFKVMPCCIHEEVQSRIDYVESDLLPEMQDCILDLKDSIENFMDLIKDENCFHDSKEQRQEIADYLQQLRSDIKDLIKEGVS